jgi:hypothetical protein
VDSIKGHNKEIARLASHRFFLSTCNELGIIPRGLDLKVPMAAALPSKSLHDDIKKISAKNSQEVIQSIICHYNKCITELRRIVELNLCQLSAISDAPHFQYLNDHINALYESYLQTLQMGKLKKIDTYLNIRGITDGKKWIPELGLGEAERRFIVDGEQLCDQIVNSVMSLVMRENPLINILSVLPVRDNTHSS